MTSQHHSQEKVTNEIDACSSTSTNSSDSVVGQEESSTMEIVQISNDSESSMDDDGWVTDTSVEKMRSAEFLSLDESVIPPPLSFRDNDLGNIPI
ncbi:hypothetical protein AVEN_221369-1 [Araneus ventricosus]|uniref:Uncharacterized protein n=1 Tax=Araneus ventricosus TaxID=182803 RepID=A0A4Y2AZC7_ARAVE|nr:hypothetical protein AVEN_221369-1 [Araneus ventricosus]